MPNTGQTLNRPNEPHHCRPPMDEYTVTAPVGLFKGDKPPTAKYKREPPVGTVWRCACGTLWEVIKNPYINVLKEGDWRKADWFTRFKYRNR